VLLTCDVQPEPRKVAFTFTTFKERPQQARKCGRTFYKPGDPALANIIDSLQPDKKEMTGLRGQIEGAKAQMQALEKRLDSLERRLVAV
jgi:predicted NBD/HSP70 family sugar kinase